MLFMVLKTARYVDPTEVIELGEILVFLGEDYVITVRHGEASVAARRPRAARGGPRAAEARARRGAPRDPGPGRRRLPPAIDGLESDIDEVEDQVFSARARNAGGAHLQAQARGAPVPHARSRRSSIRVDRLARGHYPLIHPEMRDLLPRRERPPAPRAETSSTAIRDLLTSVARRRTSPRSACARTRTCGRSPAWVGDRRRARPLIAGIYGMNFRHMPELRWQLGYPGRDRR